MEAAVHKLTTFNLGMKKEEEKAKSELVLPYLTEEQKSGQVRIQPNRKTARESSSTVSSIYYDPDSGDDWDEEDPDEDLNI